ncbi:MAG: hypothetical protein HN348_12250 [Proteobacteria bacterium]|jgi:hypothetical protein|nr:hypothetical protein [Pseudomonadota bacterium]
MSRFLAAALLFAAWPTQAQECEEPIDINRFIAGMEAVDQAIDKVNVTTARAILQDLKSTLPCCQDRVHPNHLVRYARQQALSNFWDQDEFATEYWAQMALLNPDIAWPPSLNNPDHPLRDLLGYLEPQMTIGIDGKGLAVPKGGAVLMDGVFLAEPKATIDTPHFVQRLDNDGYVIGGFWQDGSAFPDELLIEGGEAHKPPRWYEPPAADVDPKKAVKIDTKEVTRRWKLAYEAELDAYEEEQLRERALAAEKKRRERREAKEARQAAKLERKTAKEKVEQVVATTEPEPEEATPEKWLEFGFEKGRAALGDIHVLEVGSVADVDCDDLLGMEPFSIMGRLKEDQIQCLELRLRHAQKQTTKDRISRLLMADAWSKNESHRWESAVRRHLTTIGRSDAALCFIFAIYLAKQGEDRFREAIRWSNLALENSLQWEGDLRVERMYALYRLNALAAHQLWQEATSALMEDRNDVTKHSEAFWRNQTKSHAREWLAFATAAEADVELPFEVCVSAAGTADYCLVE